MKLTPAQYISMPFVLCMLISTACSDSPGGGGIDGTGKMEPIQGSGFVIGQVESVDTIVIEGQEYQAEQPEVLVNGKTGELIDIRVGMSVTAEVNKEQLTISKIEYQSAVAGPIELVRNEEDSLVILGRKN